MAYTTIKKPSDYFNTKLYTGNGSTQSITGVGFEPSLTWIKQRNGTGWHNVYDAVRGSTKRLQTNDTGAESTITNSITSFDSDGFSLGSNGDTNGSSNTTVSWNWKANGAGSANTDGSISSTVSVNATSGFSIVKWTGTNANATVGHGLGVAPKMIIIRRLESTSDWVVYHSSVGNTSRLVLNSTGASSANSAFFNNTSPTSTTFSVGSDGGSNGSTDNYIAYCFAEKTGYSKFGSYVGNSSTDGTFVYTGFKPAFLMIKATSGTEEWWTWDNKRDTYNVVDEALHANSSDAVEDSDSLDFLSNGFKMRLNSGARNGSGTTYIYMAFAQAPLVGTNNVPCTAR
jgi:hypothetical protein